MKLLQRLLLVPCLAPLLALLLISVSTPRTTSRLQILLWTSNPQPIGIWMALAGVGGAGLSGLAALLLMPAAPSLRRQLHQPVEPIRSSNDFDDQPPKGADPMPERDIRDPAPTVAVPYRIIQRGESKSPSAPDVSEMKSEPVVSQGMSSRDWGDNPDQDW